MRAKSHRVFSHSLPLAIAVFAFSAIPAQAQSLKLPTAIFIAGAAADWTATAMVNGNPRMHESNPLFSGLDHTPLMIVVGPTVDVAGLIAWNHFIGRRHPKLAAIGLYAGAAGRLWLAQRNLHFDHRLPYDHAHGPSITTIAPDQP